MRQAGVSRLVYLLVVSALAFGSVFTFAAASAKDGGGRDRGPSISKLRDIHERMSRERDRGEGIIKRLPRKSEKAFVEAMRVKYFELGKEKVERVDGRGGNDRVSPQQTGSCFEASIPSTAYTWLGNGAYVWTLHKAYCRDDGRITAEPVWWDTLKNVDPLYYDRGETEVAHFWEVRPTQHRTFVQARIENCVGWSDWVCLGNKYPWAEIRVFANGDPRISAIGDH